MAIFKEVFKITAAKGLVALMGSGELSSTMVETHKMLLKRAGAKAQAYFLDTPAGFEENADFIAERAVEFFKERVGYNLKVASLKTAAAPGAAQALAKLKGARFVLLGPGSPTYAVKQLEKTMVPLFLGNMVEQGGVLTVASAAALTVGSHTLPVYEIYKVGAELHWAKGLNILGRLGLDLVVIPHWNNAEGGTHDTHYCYMGEKRFKALEKLLPEATTILGLDEHTACILDFAAQKAQVKGIGKITLRRFGEEIYFERGQSFAFDNFFEAKSLAEQKAAPELKPCAAEPEAAEEEGRFWERMHALQAGFNAAAENDDAAGLAFGLLQMDAFLWQARQKRESPEFIAQGREIFREQVVLALSGKNRPAQEKAQAFAALVKALVNLRESYRAAKKWAEADELRKVMQKAGLTVEDTAGGPQWHFSGEGANK